MMARGTATRLAAACLAALAAGGCALEQADLEDFVETAETKVALYTAAFDAGSGAVSRVPSATSVTGNLYIINPKLFDVTYSLSWDADDSLFSTLPPASPTPSDGHNLSFAFVLESAAAEHKTITFTLGEYVAAINRTYDPETFSILCDSPPDAPARVATIVDSAQKSLLAVLLPDGIVDDDLARLRISWRREDQSAASDATYDIADLAAAPADNPFESVYDCYFQPDDIQASYGYYYTVVILDQAGQASASASTSSSANVFYVNYEGNGETGGEAPDPDGYRYKATATAAGSGSLVRTDYAFMGWNTAADGSGTHYDVGGTFAMPAGEVTLYAEWITNGTTVSFVLGSYALEFSLASATVESGETLAVSCASGELASGGTGWKWYVDGVLTASGSASFSWDTASASVGQHIVSCQVSYEGLDYSGSFRATVTQ